MSNVCKFFQTNSCRYGNRCRFRHVYEEEQFYDSQSRNRHDSRSPLSYDSRGQHNYDSRSQHNYDSRSRQNYDSRSQHNYNSKSQNNYDSRSQNNFDPRSQYSYDSRSQQIGTSILKGSGNLTRTVYNPQSKEDINLKKFTEEVAYAVKAIEEQGIWPLTCFGHVQSIGNVEGFEDISPEELRCRAYEARANGQFETYVQETQVLLKKAAAVRSVFIGKGPTASSMLKAYQLQGLKRGNSPTQTAFPESPNFHEPTPFGVNAQQHFGMQQQTSAFNTNIFAQALSDEPNEMQTSPFGQPAEGNFFGQHNANVPGNPMTFGHAQQGPPTSDLFHQNIFGNAQTSLPSGGNTFLQSQPSVFSTPFNQPSFPSQSKQVSMNVLYSQIDDLTSDELEQYKATTFTYGRIPLRPPPKELC